VQPDKPISLFVEPGHSFPPCLFEIGPTFSISVGIRPSVLLFLWNQTNSLTLLFTSQQLLSSILEIQPCFLVFCCSRSESFSGRVFVRYFAFGPSSFLCSLIWYREISRIFADLLSPPKIPDRTNFQNFPWCGLGQINPIFPKKSGWTKSIKFDWLFRQSAVQ